MSNVTLKELRDLDWIIVTELGEDSGVAQLSVLDACEYNGKLYLLAADAPADETIPEEEDSEDSEDNDADAYVFLICSREDAEFTITQDIPDGKKIQDTPVLYATTDFPEADFNAAAALFSHSSDYDVIIESDDTDDQQKK